MRANHAIFEIDLFPAQRARAAAAWRLRLPGQLRVRSRTTSKRAARASLERLGPDTVAIFWSAPARVFSTDVNYEYRQDSNLLYLTGIDQEDTILVLMPGSETRRRSSSCARRTPRREHWNGHSLTPAEASAASGIRR